MTERYEISDEGEIPIGGATIMEVAGDQRLRIINHLGQQVVDTWVFPAGRGDEFLSMEHCRGRLYKLFFEPGDALISNLRRPLVRITADTSPGRHDTLCSSCDSGSYEEYGQGTDHPNCRANFLAAFQARGTCSWTSLSPPTACSPTGLRLRGPATTSSFRR